MIHVQTWTGSGSARVTDMRNARERGKTCRVLCLSFTGTAEAPGYGEWLHAVRETLPGLPAATSYDDVLTYARALSALCDGAVSLREETVRGIDAPKERLTAGVEGVWSAHADENGVTVRCLRDRANEPTSVNRGSSARAYGIARKVWKALSAQPTYSQACRVLGDAGVDLRSYCAVD